MFAGLSQTAWCSNSVWPHSPWYRKGADVSALPQAVRPLSGAFLTTPQGTLLKADYPSPNRDSACMCLCLKSASSNPGQTRFPWIPKSLKALTKDWKTGTIIRSQTSMATLQHLEKKNYEGNFADKCRNLTQTTPSSDLLWPASFLPGESHKRKQHLCLPCKCLTINQHHKTHSGRGLDPLSLFTYSRSHSPHISFPTPPPHSIPSALPRWRMPGICHGATPLSLFPICPPAPWQPSIRRRRLDAMVTEAPGGGRSSDPPGLYECCHLTALTSPTSRQRRGSKDPYCPYTHLPDPQHPQMLTQGTNIWAKDGCNM